MNMRDIDVIRGALREAQAHIDSMAQRVADEPQGVAVSFDDITQAVMDKMHKTGTSERLTVVFGPRTFVEGMMLPNGDKATPSAIFVLGKCDVATSPQVKPGAVKVLVGGLS